MYPEPGRKNRGFLGADSSALNPQDRQDRHQLRYQLDLNSWNLRIWGVAASGFLTDSYNLFATNVIISQISFVYFPDQRWPGLVINVTTLVGSIVGQLLFGFLADYYGRTRLYGIELVLVIVSTIGVATSSIGYGDMSFLGLFTWWRFVMGVGIGAEYPLSAVITSEWSSTQSRVTMLSSVFLMQPCGQALAQLVGLWVLLGRQENLVGKQCGLNTLHEAECRLIIDGIWRIVIGSGAVPALLAIIFRFFLYDCGLYTLEVKNKPGTAFRNTQRVYGAPAPLSTPSFPEGMAMANGNGNTIALSSSGVGTYSPRGWRGGAGGLTGDYPLLETPTPVQFAFEDMWNYFIRDGNWWYLLGTSATWFLLDVSFYGFSLDNRGTLADLWATKNPVEINSSLRCWNSTLEGGNSTVPTWVGGKLPTWQTDPTQPCNSIYNVLLEQAKQYLLSVSIASIAGSACFVYAANKFHRRRWLIVSFLALAVLFVITGVVYYGVNHTSAAPATVAMVAICHFAFNFGANTLTFIIPAEIFPTAYRSTCHGISAAAGKCGSVLAVLVVYGINQAYNSSTRQGLIFLLFSTIMVLGALCSWAYLPDVQRRVPVLDDSVSGQARPGPGGVAPPPGRGEGVGVGPGPGPGVGRPLRYRLENMNLEELGEGREKARREGEVIGIRGKLSEIRRRRGQRNSTSTAPSVQP